MKMLLAIALFGGVMYGQTTVNTSCAQKFCLLNAPVTVVDENGSTTHIEHHVLLLDSSTGRIWVYTPTSVGVLPGQNKALMIPSVFLRVWVEGVDSQNGRPQVKTVDTVPSGASR